MVDDKSPIDLRVLRTRQRLLDGFARIASEQRYDKISIKQLVSTAGTGRATFYEHFRDKDALLIASLEPLLLPLANAASGRASKAAVRMALSHIWEKRALFRSILDATVQKKLVWRLAEMIETRLDLDGTGVIPNRITAVAAAQGQLAILRLWISGEVSVPAEALAWQLLAFQKLRLDMVA